MMFLRTQHQVEMWKHEVAQIADDMAPCLQGIECNTLLAKAAAAGNVAARQQGSARSHAPRCSRTAACNKAAGHAGFCDGPKPPPEIQLPQMPSAAPAHLHEPAGEFAHVSCMLSNVCQCHSSSLSAATHLVLAQAPIDPALDLLVVQVMP